jgi:alkaline phosphatase D
MPLRFLRSTFAVLLAGLCVPLALSGQTPAFSRAIQLTHVNNGANSAAAQSQHYVVLVSLDGFRWDYARRDNARNLLALGQQGAWAPQGMLPSYPSLTFPNHYTLVTGLYPEHHGLVANNFYDPARKAHYSMSDPEAVTDGSWYGGVPLWSLAEAQGMRSAVLYWPGSEAKIAGFRPSYYASYDGKTERTPESRQARIDDAVALLRLPAADRPHFIAIYFSEPDHSGHQFGPDAAETRDAVRQMDAIVGKLRAALHATGLPIDLVVVSDHGMVKSEGNWIDLSEFADLKNFETVGDLLYGKSEEESARAYNQLKKASSEFVVYRRKDVPAELHYSTNPREGDPVVIATGPYAIRAASLGTASSERPPTAGMHGFDPRLLPQMKASFFAAGPDLLAGKTLAPFDNVNLYPWIAHLLGLNPPPSDGSLNILSATLRDGGAAPSQESEKTVEK